MISGIKRDNSLRALINPSATQTKGLFSVHLGLTQLICLRGIKSMIDML